MIAIVSLLLVAGGPLPLTQAMLEQKMVDCGLSLAPIKDRYGRYTPDAATFYSSDGIPGVRIFANKPGNACIAAWLKANVPTYIIERSQHEQ
jgi:hypothetical protein